MTHSIEKQINECEERLRLAMLDSDVDVLGELLAPELMFTNHMGQVLTKQDDLTAHRTGTVKINVLAPSDRQIRLIGDVAVVSVRVRLAGSYEGNASEGDFRFTRVWTVSAPGHWHVIAAHSTIVAGV